MQVDGEHRLLCCYSQTEDGRPLFLLPSHTFANASVPLMSSLANHLMCHPRAVVQASLSDSCVSHVCALTFTPNALGSLLRRIYSKLEDKDLVLVHYLRPPDEKHADALAQAALPMPQLGMLPAHRPDMEESAALR